MKKLTTKQTILMFLACLLYAGGFVFDGAPAGFFSVLIAVILTAYIVHTLPPVFKNESN